MMSNDSDFQNPYERMVLDGGYCFLCGADLSEVESSDEHVFPKWLQRRHNLWNEELQLLNGTTIRYRQLKVPCCRKCNNDHLGELENVIQSATEDGYKTCEELDDLTIFQWMAKLFFGILRKELSLLVDRSDPSKGTIVTEDVIESFNNLHGFLQSVRRPAEFFGLNPFSVLVANVHSIGDSQRYFFRDNLFLMVASLRTEGVGFIVSFEDAEFSQSTYGRYLEEVDGRKLHPLQFDELYAKVVYQTYRMSGVPKFTTVSSKDDSQPFTVLTNYGGPIDDWDQEEFSQFLAETWSDWGAEFLEQMGLDLNNLFQPPNLVMSTMTDSNDELYLVDATGNPLGDENSSSA
jgi:hypothetical protein